MLIWGIYLNNIKLIQASLNPQLSSPELLVFKKKKVGNSGMNYSDNLLLLDFIFFGYNITFSVTKIGKKKRFEFK